MRKIYTLCVLLLISLMYSAASAFTITFNVDNPDNVRIEVSYSEIELQAGDNPVEFASSYTSIEISGKNGCKVTATAPDGTLINTDYFFFSSEALYGGKTITVTSQTPEEFRTGTVNVNIDKASAVKIGVQKSSSSVSYYPELTDGDNTIYYEPDVDKMLRIYSSVSAQVPLYSVTVVNGTTVPVLLNNVYEIPLPCDGDVVVRSVFPEQACTVTLNMTEGIEGFVKKITKDTPDGEEVDFSSGSFSVNAGTVLYIYGNSDDYLLSSYMVDGEEVPFSSPQRLIVVDKDITLSFDGFKYNQYDITINVDNPSYIVARFGTKLDPGAEIPLDAGTNIVSVSENNPFILITVSDAHDYKITSLKCNDVSVEPDYSGTYTVEARNAADAIEISTAEIVRDLKAVVYLDEANGDFKLVDSFGYEVKLNTGYNHIYFCKEDTPFKLSPTGFYNTSAFVYSNDQVVSDNGGFGSGRVYSINASDGSVVKIFAVASEEPQWYTVNFDGSGFDDVDVIADEIRPVADRVGFETLVATKIEIVPKDGKVIESVTVDGEPLTASDGKYEFTVSGNHSVMFSSTTAIHEIQAEDAVVKSVYNLQGIRVNKAADQLPAGIYIINGKKVLVK